ncbi:di-trans,poly-cis-decaprenylcistransferase [Candidatus Roizmanbacteria bacterium RIFCSPHIGHO2_02_FULL_40_53]|nr:MAG: di-trans,poly-cis-decaprenylcistransferase [Candidatus Roizmanbacteria bacterium RIFCSPHIGHO2_02_FULL_40_53]
MKNIPVHLAIIPDGNRRWAKSKGLPTFEGHRKGFEAVSQIAKRARDLGVKVFTVWAFSTENWNRTKEEVSHLMKIYEEWVRKNTDKAIKDRVRLIHLGRKDRIPQALRRALENAEKKTQKFNKNFLVLALDYGGRDEILRAFQKAKNSKKNIRSEEDVAGLLDTKNLPYPYPDLVIRTSGEQRTSGFMSWQTAYSEFIFVQKHLPDFKPNDLERCFEEFATRKRRFGK